MDSYEKLIKVGYFREVRENGGIRYISYREFLDFPMEVRATFRSRFESGGVRFFCACNSENILPLTITANNIIRVSENGGQSRHMESCPKSVYYSRWLEESSADERGVKGVSQQQDADGTDKVLFHISLPQLIKQESSSADSPGAGTGQMREKRIGLLPMVVALNKMVWEKQTFSAKKAIRLANRSKQPPSWDYKDLESFNRFVYGASNDILVKFQGCVVPFRNLFYNREQFYSSSSGHRQWFIYAPVERVSEFKESRKYQYVTVRMPSDKSANRSVIRIPTDDFKKIFSVEDDGTVEGMPGSSTYILAGYIVRKYFTGSDGSVSDWMQLTKGVLIQVNKYGLYCENEAVLKASEYLSEHHVIFKRPYVTMENYGGLIPSFEIERTRDKNVIIDYPQDAKEYTQRRGFIRGNEEYSVVCVEPGEDDMPYLDHIIKMYGRRSE